MTIKTGSVKTEKTNTPAVENKKGTGTKRHLDTARPHEVREREKASQSIGVTDVSTLQGDRKKKA